MPLKVAWSEGLTNYSLYDSNMVLVEYCLYPLPILHRWVQQKLSFRFKRGLSKGFRQNIRVQLFRSYEYYVNLLGTK